MHGLVEWMYLYSIVKESDSNKSEFFATSVDWEMRFFKHIPECLKLFWELFHPLWLGIIQQIYSNGLLKSLDKQITNWRRDFLFRGQMQMLPIKIYPRVLDFLVLTWKLKKGKIAFGLFFLRDWLKIGTWIQYRVLIISAGLNARNWIANCAAWH